MCQHCYGMIPEACDGHCNGFEDFELTVLPSSDPRKSRIVNGVLVSEAELNYF